MAAAKTVEIVRQFLENRRITNCSMAIKAKRIKPGSTTGTKRLVAQK